MKKSLSSATREKLLALAANRIAIEAVAPQVDGGRFAVKRVVGEPLMVSADIFGDGHEVIGAALLVCPPGSSVWQEVPMRFVANDRWEAELDCNSEGLWHYTIIGWRDAFGTWLHDTRKKKQAGLNITLELEEARILLDRALKSGRGTRDDARALKDLLKQYGKLLKSGDAGEQFSVLDSFNTQALLEETGPRDELTVSHELPLWVDRKRAAFSAWYELMPRSQSGDVNRHGTFDDVIARLPDVQEMGFDVLYMPPIHPIGKAHRKGRNNALTATADDPGSPYAIGSDEGGHDAIHPELGSFDDFARLIAAARQHGMDVALDFAIQCSPDHPWIRQHPEWFDWRPDGTIKYAENPPKKYQDIVNVDFYREGALPSLWIELRDVVLFWLEKGVRIFRVDNPHTKPFPFWEWLIAEVRQVDPGVIFLAEAFTRPKLMKRLAKVGFNQSYSYFTWRDEKWELEAYLTELTQEECVDYMRPNFFVNTPDINPFYLQTSGRPGFRIRLALAATLAGNYGIYSGFELCEYEPVPGREEYLNSEKYEIRAFDWFQAGNIRPDIRFFNELRQTHESSWDFPNLKFYHFGNDNILYYGRMAPDKSSMLLFMVLLDPHAAQGGQYELPLWEFGLADDAMLNATNLVTGQKLQLQGKQQHWWINPDECPYVVLNVFA
ncbi:alpha-1,4-glucan--maltose-1-phosphate maltosyltransferase [Aureimonas fodinaquatilis]|uniref:Alpha-1,4-glucan:maltose-1-phosphate maltosyltransferase n=2 Tax=Aureimonas fodinaquatilis TaxID=2565783 RepID=A0A5B0DQA0_9HYPH|nr:alpha-1,4-glucan--maltose-1-phosphate maltosyltransferase [Aureimonas fodinaquatilis]